MYDLIIRLTDSRNGLVISKVSEPKVIYPNRKIGIDFTIIRTKKLIGDDEKKARTFYNALDKIPVIILTDKILP